jgi:hypothetical protein
MLKSCVDVASDEMGLKISKADDEQLRIFNVQGEFVVFVAASIHANSVRTGNPMTAVCRVEEKSYNKQFMAIEKKVLKSLAGNKARFSEIAAARSLTPN